MLQSDWPECYNHGTSRKIACVLDQSTPVPHSGLACDEAQCTTVTLLFLRVHGQRPECQFNCNCGSLNCSLVTSLEQEKTKAALMSIASSYNTIDSHPR